MQLSINIIKDEDYFIGTIKEFPAVLTQGSTIEETTDNLLDALQLYIACCFDESKSMIEFS